MTRQKSLTEELIKASEVYYNDGHALMSDLEFDHKIEELKKLEAESGTVLPGSPTQNVGAKAEGLKKARHEQPALSLDKVKYKDRESLKKWLGNRQAVMSWKCDGNTLVVSYDNGMLTSAVTRGDGTEGSDVTHNARFFKGIPQKIPYTGHLVVRGEAMMTYAEFERVNAEANGSYENPRNLAAATIQMLDAEESRKREIIFRAFELVTPEPKGEIIRTDGILISLAFMGDRLDWLERLGFDVVDYEYIDSTDVLQKIEEWRMDIQNLPYPTDGLVFSYNNLYEGWALGSTGHHPRWAMALKWTDETYTTTIRDIEWTVGKTGIITPVAVFDEVRMGLGSNVTRASLHNVSTLKKLAHMSGDGRSIPIIGSDAEVYMANMIIPQVASVSHTPDTVSAEIPCECPVCGRSTRLSLLTNTGVETLHCDNPYCAAQQTGRLVNALSKDGLNVKGLSEKKIAFLLQEGYIEDVLDVYRLKDQGNESGVLKKDMTGPALEDQPGWEIKSVDNLLDAIEKSRKTTLQRFLYSLNIPLLGNDLSKKLSKYWHDNIGEFVEFVERVDEGAGGYDDFGQERAFDILTKIDGVGEEKARSIVGWAVEITAYREKWEDFMSLVKELNFPEPTSGSADSSLEGLTFVITGSVHQYKSRDEFKASVEARGGKVAGSVSAKTSFLVNNDVESTSGKNQKAKELGIEIISEDEFIAKYGE